METCDWHSEPCRLCVERCELIEHDLCPPWLKSNPSEWPKPSNQQTDDEKEICLAVTTQSKEPIIPLPRFSSFSHLKRVTAWSLRFINSCLTQIHKENRSICIEPCLTKSELIVAERYWLSLAQHDNFDTEIESLQSKECLICSETNGYQSLPLFVCLIDCEGRTGVRFNDWSLYCCTTPICLSKRLSFSNVERSWHQFCWCKSWAEGAKWVSDPRRHDHLTQ